MYSICLYLKPPSIRLSKHVKPALYKLHLHPNLIAGGFVGKVAITINITQATNEIVLHAQRLSITKVEFQEAGGQNIEVSQQHIQQDDKLLFDNGNCMYNFFFYFIFLFRKSLRRTQFRKH